MKVGGFTLPVRYRGQQRTCKICEEPGHLATDCPARGRCFVCGSYSHQANWHRTNDKYNNTTDESDQEDKRSTESTQVIYVPRERPTNSDHEQNYDDEEADVTDKATTETKETEPEPQKSTLNKKSFAEAASQSGQTKETGKSSRPPSFWDDAVKTGRTKVTPQAKPSKSKKRKSPEENQRTSTISNKMSRDDRYEEESDMEEEHIQHSEQENTSEPELTSQGKQYDTKRPERKTPTKYRSRDRREGVNEDDGKSDNSLVDEEETDQNGFVVYTRGGVRRTRKKRTSWVRKTTDTHSDSQPSTSNNQDKQEHTSQPSQNTPRGRGRGRPAEKV